MKIRPAKNPGAVSGRDPYLVVFKHGPDDYEEVESWASEERARQALRVLRDHSRKNGLARDYEILARHELPDPEDHDELAAIKGVHREQRKAFNDRRITTYDVEALMPRVRREAALLHECACGAAKGSYCTEDDVHAHRSRLASEDDLRATLARLDPDLYARAVELSKSP